MEKGDLAVWMDDRIVVVLEGVLASIPEPEIHKSGVFGRNRTVEWVDADHWMWSHYAVKQINDKAYRLNVSIDVVTFLSPDVADLAAEWMLKYDVRVSGVEYSDFDMFCQSLSWRPSIHHVVDTDPRRLAGYGIRAYETHWNGIF